MIGYHCRGQYFRRSRGGAINQNRNRTSPNHFARFGGKGLSGNGLPAQCGNRPRRNKEASDVDCFRNWAAAALAQVQNYLVNSLLVRIGKAVANFVSASGIERRHTQRQDVGFCLLPGNLRPRQPLAHDIPFFRLRTPSPPPPYFSSGAASSPPSSKP